MPKRGYQKSVDGDSYIVPKEALEARPVEVSAKQFKELVPREKKPMSEAQKAHVEKLVAANKERKRIRDEEKAKLAAIPEIVEKVVEEEKKFKEEVLKPTKRTIKKEQEDALLAAGTHVKIVVKKRAPRKKVVEVTETETSDMTTDTEDTDVEEYKTKARQVRKAAVAKKLVRTVEKIDRVIQQAAPVPSNPYLNMLSSRWR
jgi:hypothetical protein